MSSSVHIRFPISLKTERYRAPAVRAFVATLAVTGGLWALALKTFFSGQPEFGLGFPFVTLLAVLGPVVVLARGLAKARRAHDAYHFDTIVYADSTRVVLAHSLKGTRHELFEAQIHAWLVVGRRSRRGAPVTAPKTWYLEVVDQEGDILRSEPQKNAQRLRTLMRDLGYPFTEEDPS